MATNIVNPSPADILFPIDPELQLAHSGLSPDSSPMAVDARSRSATPVPPDEHEALDMRTRALAIRDAKGKGREDSPENELVEMVLRLTAALPSRTQVFDQAATIRRLSHQQDFLLQRISDERAAWDAEREGMHRVSEALIAQANIASHNLYKEQDPSKKPTYIENENNNLRQKLHDIQAKVTSLEAELTQLRPLLLMQPQVIAASRGVTIPSPKPRKKESTTSNENRSYYRVREEKATPPSKSRKKKATTYFKHAPIVVDARSEHLLLAARKIGKERASMVSQAMYRAIEMQAQSAASRQASAWTTKPRGDGTGPLMSPAVWPNHPSNQQQPPQLIRQYSQQYQAQTQPSGSANQARITPNIPQQQSYGSPGIAYPQNQQYFMPAPAGSVGRPGPGGAAMPAPTFYHAPPRGYIPGPAWPYYTPNPYSYGQPIAIQNAGVNQSKKAPATASPAHPSSGQVPASAGPADIPVPSTPLIAPPSGKNSEKDGSSQTQRAPPETQPVQNQEAARSGPATVPPASTKNHPQTAMDNLLSAARTVFSPESNSGNRPAEGRESPTPNKRRRVEGQPGSQTAVAPVMAEDINPEKQFSASEAAAIAAGLERRTSSLDVLADQAASANTNNARGRSSGPAARAPIPSSQQSKPIPKQQPRPRKRKLPENVSRGSSKTPANETTPTQFIFTDGLAKRPPRASSSTASSRTPAKKALAASTPAQRAASEEHPPTVSPPSRGASSAFRLRPVGAFAQSDVSAPPVAVRSSSLPRTVVPTATTSAKGRKQNGRLSATPLGPPFTRVPVELTRKERATPSSVGEDADAEGEDCESEDVDVDVEADVDMDADVNLDADVDVENEVDELANEEDEPPTPRKGNRSVSALQPRSTGDDINSRRWMEILGRKDA